MQNSLPIKNKLSKINLNCEQIENGKRLYKYNIVVGAGKHVMKDIENSLTLKTRRKENTLKLTYLYLLNSNTFS